MVVVTIWVVNRMRMGLGPPAGPDDCYLINYVHPIGVQFDANGETGDQGDQLKPCPAEIKVEHILTGMA